MEMIKLIVLSTVLALFVLFFHFITRIIKFRKLNLPKGTLGLPIIGETLEFFKANLEGKQIRFIQERMKKYDTRVFKTSMLGENVAVFCGTAGNKYLFSNENKNVQLWWPSSVKKLLRLSLVNKIGDEAKITRRLLMSFLNPETLRNYLSKMDRIAQHHINTHWKGNEQVVVYPIIQLYTFELACCLFLSMEDGIQLSNLSSYFEEFLKGVIGFSINFPGTRFHKAMKVVTPDTSGRFMSEAEILDNMLLLLFAGHDTSRSVISLIMKYLGNMQWEDVQKMKYSWNVASEVLRLSPPVGGAYRNAMKDLTYADYNIPYSYVPFGGGPRMCLGQEFARLEILVFMHNIVKRFKWDLVNPDEKFKYDPMLEPLIFAWMKSF